jgi:hypothetical protein
MYRSIGKYPNAAEIPINLPQKRRTIYHKNAESLAYVKKNSNFAQVFEIQITTF